MTQEQALEKAREIVAAGGSFMLGTVDAQNRPRMRWMGAIACDPDNELIRYMECGAQSRKMAELAANPAAQLVFNSADFSCVVTVDGVAGAVEDMDTKRMVYEAVPASADYFPSPESEMFGVIRFQATVIEVLCMSEGHEPVRVEL